MRAALAALLVLLVAATAAARHKRRHRRHHHHHKPKVQINMPRGWEWPPTRDMRAEGKDCRARLSELGVAWKKAPRTRKITTPIYLTDMEIGGVRLTSIWRKGPFPMECFFVLAFAEKGASALRNVGIRELRFTSIHDYREVNGKKGVLSRHALGLAMDVFELVDEIGTKHVVLWDYPSGDSLLLAAEAAVNATGAYRMLLTPGNDPLHHYDHFHFEARTPGERVETPAAVPAAAAP